MLPSPALAGSPKLRELLAAHSGYEVRFIAVAGVPEILDGAAMMLGDLDILVPA